MSFLLEVAGETVNVPDIAGSTGLHKAASQGNEKMLELLLGGGADVKGADNEVFFLFFSSFYSFFFLLSFFFLYFFSFFLSSLLPFFSPLSSPSPLSPLRESLLSIKQQQMDQKNV